MAQSSLVGCHPKVKDAIILLVRILFAISLVLKRIPFVAMTKDGCACAHKHFGMLNQK